jgi:hypothetical protein
MSNNPAALCISHGQAVKMFDSVIAWLQVQDEVSPYNVSVLRELREVAAKKRMNSLIQGCITDYFRSN